MQSLLFAGYALAAYLVTLIVLPKVKEMLVEAGFVRPNFHHEQIPLGVGLVFFLAVMVVITVGQIFIIHDHSAFTFLFAVGGMGMFGLIDDVFGTRGASGLKGHFKKLFIERELTTGALKALAGCLIALLISVEVAQGRGHYKWISVLVNTLIIALSTNAINLLDLRPGRAGKGFLLLGLFIVAAGTARPQLFYLAAMIGSLIAFIPQDLKARAMMGDTGSNVLGMTLGYSAIFMPFNYKIGYLLFLIVFHLVTEKYSLTRIIEHNRVLNYVDMLGRK